MRWEIKLHHTIADGISSTLSSKVSFKARLKDQNWVDEDIRTSNSLQVAGSVVYGYPLTVSGDLVMDRGEPSLASQFLPQLK